MKNNLSFWRLSLLLYLQTISRPSGMNIYGNFHENSWLTSSLGFVLEAAAPSPKYVRRDGCDTILTDFTIYVENHLRRADYEQAPRPLGREDGRLLPTRSRSLGRRLKS
jgi:hypothetical protein